MILNKTKQNWVQCVKDIHYNECHYTHSVTDLYESPMLLTFLKLDLSASPAGLEIILIFLTVPKKCH